MKKPNTNLGSMQAAAPAMYEALRLMVENMDREREPTRAQIERATKAARAALAAAEGR